MLIRENIELLERTYLSPFATLSENSKGRDREEPQCDIRPVFQRDRDRILHCKSFRRLKHKTQVFLTPPGRPLPYQTDAYVGSVSKCPNDSKGFAAE